MNVFLTGSNGHIGAVLSRMLLEEGHEVTGCDAGYFEDCGFGEQDPAPPALGDIRELAARDLAGFDAVIHLAALCNDPLSDLNPYLTEEIN